MDSAGSSASWNSTSSIFGSHQGFGQDNGNRNPYAAKQLGSATLFGSPIGVSSSGGTLTWEFGQTSPPLSSATCGASSLTGSSVFDQKPPLGFNSFQTFGQQSMVYSGSGSLATTPSSGFGTGSSLSGVRAAVPMSSFNRSDFGDRKRGSKLAAYRKTSEAEDAGKLVSISAMPVYEGRSHEELRWEDHQLTGKGGLGLNSSTIPNSSSSSPFSFSSFKDYSSTLLSTSSEPLSTTPVNPNAFTYPVMSLAPCTPTWSYPCPTSTASTSQNRGFSTSRIIPTATSTTATLSAPLFGPYSSVSNVSTTQINPFAPRTVLSSPNCSAPSCSAFSPPSFRNCAATALTSSSTSISPTPLNPNPSINPFASLAAHAPTWTIPGSTASALTSQLGFPSSGTTPITSSTTATVPTPVFGPYTCMSTGTSTPFNPFAPSRAHTSPNCSKSSLSPFTNSFFKNCAATSLSTASTSISPTPVDPNPFKNPFTSVAAHAPTWEFPGTTFSANTTWTTICTPSLSTSTAAAHLVSASPMSPGSVFNVNQTETLLKPHIPLSTRFSGEITEINRQNSTARQSASGSEQPSSDANPHGILPPKPQMILEGLKSTGSIRYGISSMPVQDKPAAQRGLSLPTFRHLSRRSRMAVQKYDPKLNGPKVPFFGENEEIPVAVFLPRENPRALMVYPERWTLRANTRSSTKEDGVIKADGSLNDDPTKESDLLVTVPDVLELLPKLQASDYYTEPQISELEANERAEPGFCSHVRDFVVGRHGYGSIKFFGETDVRKLDLQTCIQFNHREVIVYMDECKKPPVGEGLNKAAEVTLLNIKCINKITGKQYMDEQKVDKFREMLVKKAVEHGAEFVSYDPVGGVWKFRVQHF